MSPWARRSLYALTSTESLGWCARYTIFVAIGRPPRPAVVTDGVGEALHVGAVHLHGVDVEVAVLERREDDPLAVGGEDALGGVDVVVGKALDVRPVAIDGEDVVLVERPHIALRWSGTRRTSRVVGGGRAEEEALATGKEPAAGSLAAAVADALELRTIGLHHVLLVAGASFTRGLERDPLAVAAPVRLGVLAAVGDLAEIGEVRLARLGRNGTIWAETGTAAATTAAVRTRTKVLFIYGISTLGAQRRRGRGSKGKEVALRLSLAKQIKRFHQLDVLAGFAALDGGIAEGEPARCAYR